MTEEQFVHNTLCGDQQAFEHLVRKYQGMVYACAYQILGNFSDS